MQGTDYTTGAIRALRDALNSYTNDYPNQVELAHNALAPFVAAAKTKFDSIPSTIVASYSNAATPLKAGPSPAAPATALAATYVTDANTQLNTLTAGALNDITTTIRPQLVLADASYDALGAQPSAVSPGSCALPMHIYLDAEGWQLG